MHVKGLTESRLERKNPIDREKVEEGVKEKGVDCKSSWGFFLLDT